YPDINPIENNPFWEGTCSENSNDGAIGLEFCYRTIQSISYPKVGTVEEDRPRNISNGKGSKHQAVIRSQLRYGVILRVSHPDVLSIKSDSDGQPADAKRSLGDA